VRRVIAQPHAPVAVLAAASRSVCDRAIHGEAMEMQTEARLLSPKAGGVHCSTELESAFSYTWHNVVLMFLTHS